MGTKERRILEKQRRRAEILNAARRIFRENGFKNSTMPGIAKTLELAPGTLYLYFPSKETLYLELLLEGYDVLINKLRGAAALPDSASDKASVMIDVFLEFAHDSPEHFDVIFFMAQRESGSLRNSGFEGSQIEQIAARENECKRIIAAVIDGMSPDRGHTEGSGFNPDAEVVWSLLAGLVTFWRMETEDHRRTVTERAKDIILSYYSRHSQK
ncbi:MAG: TetR/AcrR family transcriptional regulator [Victivallales bacterium]|nr:TetR/AcrR family transcriptional regulator [Victivallales bacterium]